MTNQQKLDEIKSRLTKCKDVDVPFLQTELVVFRTLNNEEMVTALEQLLFTYLTKEEKQEYDEKAHEILSVRYQKFQEAQELLNKEKLDDAKNILESLIKTYEKIENVKTYNYFDFEQLMDYIVYTKNVENARKLNVKRYPEQITYYCYLVASIYQRLGQIKDAIKYLEKALKFNPVSSYVILELLSLYDQANDDKIYDLCLFFLDVAYTKDALASSYLYLGNYFSKYQDYEMALMCYFVSDSYYDAPYSKAKIDAISEEYKKDFSISDIKNAFKVRNIPFGISKDVILASNDFLNYLKAKKDFNSMKYILSILYDLTEDEIYKEKLEMLGKEK